MGKENLRDSRVIELYSAADIAEIYNVSVRTIWNWVERNQIPAPNIIVNVKTKRWTKERINDFRQNQKNSRKLP